MNPVSSCGALSPGSTGTSWSRDKNAGGLEPSLWGKAEAGEFSLRAEGSGTPGTRNSLAGPAATGERRVFNLREGRFRLDTRKTFLQ